MIDPAPLDTLPNRDCGSPMKHDEHLLLQLEDDKTQTQFRCPGREEDE